MYVTATHQVLIQMKASFVLICHLTFKYFYVYCQTWLCVLLYSGKIKAYMLRKKKQFWLSFAVDKYSSHRMKCVCVCMITNWDHLECCMQSVCWNVIKFLFFFSSIFPQWTFTEDLGVLKAGSSMVGCEDRSKKKSGYCGITDLWIWKVAAESNWNKTPPEPS